MFALHAAQVGAVCPLLHSRFYGDNACVALHADQTKSWRAPVDIVAFLWLPRRGPFSEEFR